MIITLPGIKENELEIDIADENYFYYGDTFIDWDELPEDTKGKLLDIDERIKGLTREAMELVS